MIKIIHHIEQRCVLFNPFRNVFKQNFGSENYLLPLPVQLNRYEHTHQQRHNPANDSSRRQATLL